MAQATIDITPLHYRKSISTGGPIFGFRGYYTANEYFYVELTVDNQWRAIPTVDLRREHEAIYQTFHDWDMLDMQFDRRKDVIAALQQLVASVG